MTSGLHVLGRLSLAVVLGGAVLGTAGTPGHPAPLEDAPGPQACPTGPASSWCLDSSLDEQDEEDRDVERTGQGQGDDRCGWETVPIGPDTNPHEVLNLTNGRPPEGEDVVWQGWCYSERYEREGYNGPYRWLPAGSPEPQSPAEVARGLYEEMRGRVPDPVVLTNPPAGTDAIATVPVFVTVTNWTGELVESDDLLDETVTVRATPELTLVPGEPGGDVQTCAGPGVRYDPDGGDLWAQADAPMACAHAYDMRTGVEGRPEEWPSTVTVRWSIAWSATTGDDGSFPTVERSVAVPRGVGEVQAVVTSGGR